MKTVLTIAILSLLTACASKNTTANSTATTNAPAAKVVTPSTTEASQKAEDKKAAKHDKHHNAKATTKADSPAAKAASTDATAKAATTGTAEVNCKAGADERKLAIVVKDAGCELQYTKAGAMTVKATQINGSEKCEEVMTQIKEKLVAAKFECN